MNDYDPNTMSRSKRPKKNKLEPKFSRKSDAHGSNKGFLVLLVVLALAIISFVPVYGMMSNQKAPKTHTAVSSSAKRSSSSDKSSSSESSETTTSESSSSEEVDSSSSDASSDEVASSSSSDTVESSSSASSSTTTTAVLGSNQTLYNFAVTHGMTTSQVIALNPGLTVANYTQYAGTALNIQ
ncbi:peptidoglycan-binding protein LysM [Leuconostoc litchii]|uniref:Peptidoglycan-binding protein LysM n=2 Tax=Leuconostoc litchii TaxID=1981069 RepID=A0A6P2CP82_9LACO|nr:peptidoglycan-binding protein LysM [Leuconostoc litchii]TYC46791.1 peptidoglycan-binding protein LysM [Leuconostoc litchii]